MMSYWILPVTISHFVSEIHTIIYHQLFILKNRVSRKYTHRFHSLKQMAQKISYAGSKRKQKLCEN